MLNDTDAEPTPTTSHGTTGSASAPDAPSPSASTTTPQTNGLDESGGSSDEGTEFLFQPDTPDVRYCNSFDNDCPRGEKCTFWASDGGNWNATRCVPIVDDPAGVGEPCEAMDGPTSGLDTCDAMTMCWSIDPKTGIGHCIGLCGGSPESPSCDDPCTTCSIGGGPLALCVAQCDPIQQDCPEGEACYALNQGFNCAPDVSGEGGKPGQPCEFLNVCEKGTFCLSAEVWPPGACDAGSGCCVPTCDTQAADPCPNTPEGVACVPWYTKDNPPPASECHDWLNAGVCALP